VPVHRREDVGVDPRDLGHLLDELRSTQVVRHLVLDNVHPGARRAALLARLELALAELQGELDAREAVAVAAVEAMRA